MSEALNFSQIESTESESFLAEHGKWLAREVGIYGKQLLTTTAGFVLVNELFKQCFPDFPPTFFNQYLPQLILFSTAHNYLKESRKND